jgi:hypothetical protein
MKGTIVVLILVRGIAAAQWTADSTDNGLIRQCLRDEYKRVSQSICRDSAAGHKNIWFLDSLTHDAWLPDVPGGGLFPISYSKMEDLVRQTGRKDALRLAGLYGGSAAKTVILEQVECYFSRKNTRGVYIVDRREQYLYRRENGVWKGGSTKTTIFDHAPAAVE